MPRPACCGALVCGVSRSRRTAQRRLTRLCTHARTHTPHTPPPHWRLRRPDGVEPEYRKLCPVVLVVVLLLVSAYQHRKGTWHLLLSLKEVVMAPFGKVTFYTSFVADVITSMVKVLTDAAYCVCFIASGEWLPGHRSGDGNSTESESGSAAEMQLDSACRNPEHMLQVWVIPLLCVLPLWFRFMQCLRRYRDTHERWPILGNALKYAVAHTVVIFSVFSPHLNHLEGGRTWTRDVWIFCCVLSTLYTFSWDVFMVRCDVLMF